MIIANIPIKASQTIRVIFDWIKLYFSQPHKSYSDSKIAFVYFSYQPDFEFIKLSLKSLVEEVDNNLIAQIFLFIDQKAPFSEQEISSLKALYPGLVTHPIYGFSWASTQTTHSELGAFKEVSKSIRDIDLIAKVDSDILFFKNQRLKKIASGTDHVVGDGHYVNYDFAQGGLYFIRNKTYKSTLYKADLKDIKKAEIECKNKGEDYVISTMMRSYKKPFQLSRYMLFKDEYTKISRLNCVSRWEFCALHFSQDKENMKSYYQKLISQNEHVN